MISRVAAGHRSSEDGGTTSVFDEIDWEEVRQHYDERVETHERLTQLHDGNLRKHFFRLALGIERSSGNYSAAEHGNGPRMVASLSRADDKGGLPQDGARRSTLGASRLR